MREHQVKSRAGAEQKFKGGLADEGEKTVALHTATHLLLAGLRKYVGNHVHQAGSNITTERARFDFTHTEKVGREVLDQVEAYVNEAIQKGCTVAIEETPKEEAKQKGAEGSFWEKYPDVVKVYKVMAPDGTVYSQELCGGPHVKNAGVLGHFKIVKEEAVSAGVRRIKAVLE
jgi:alanyl-tRNA synthetase